MSESRESQDPEKGLSSETERSIDPVIVGGALAFLGPPTAVALDHFLSGREEEPSHPAPPEIVLPAGVYVDDD